MVEALRAYALDQLQNDFFVAGAGLGALGIGAALLRHAAIRLTALVRLRLFLTITVEDRGDLFACIERWLHAHSYAAGRCRNLLASGERRGGRTALMLTPGPGRHLLRHGGMWLLVERESRDGREARGRRRSERFKVHALWRHRSTVRELLQDAARRYGRPDPDAVAVYAPDSFDDWHQVASVAQRPVDTVILPERVAESLLADVRAFLDGADWYRRRGLPHRRGYLLSGPPGTGKSTLVRAVAGALDLDLCLIDLSAANLDDQRLLGLLAVAPNPGLLLIEDVDAAFSGRAAEGEAGGRLTFSGLLNALDGVAAQEGRLLFMTTNHPERLDPALVRPGRVDVRLELGLCDEHQLRRLFLAFFPGEDRLAARFAERVGPGIAPPAAIQGHLLLHRDSAVGAAAAALDLDPFGTVRASSPTRGGNG